LRLCFDRGGPDGKAVREPWLFNARAKFAPESATTTTANKAIDVEHRTRSNPDPKLLDSGTESSVNTF